jgi:restriction endonuclease S subunit
MDFIQNQTTGIKNLRLDDFFKILVIKPSIAEQKKVAQKAIKSREEAKGLLEKAKTILASIDKFVLDELGIEIERERERVSEPAQIWQIWSDAIEKRLDPMFFHPLRLRAIEAIKKSRASVVPLSEAVKFRRELVSDIPENTPYVGLENIVSNSGEYIETNTKESISSAFVFKKGDVLFPKLRPYLNKVFYADFDGICSTEFHVFEAEKCDPYFLFSFLTRSVVVEQTSRLMTGNTLPRLQTEDIENLLIPIPNESTQEKIVAGVKTIYTKARNLRQEAESVIVEAQKQTAEMIFA